MTSYQPACDSNSRMFRLSCCGCVYPPAVVSPSIAVTGMLSYPYNLAISSIRSTSRVISPRREGTVTSSVSSEPSLVWNCRRERIVLISNVEISVPK
ncbi:hypothetical protein D3C77_331500 [compost metagenome]